MLWRIAIAALVLLGIGVNVKAADDDGVVRFRIERLPLAEALNRFAAQSDIDVAFAVGTPVPDFKRGLHGLYRPEEALEKLLRNTGLVYEFETPNLVILRRNSASVRIPALLGGDDQDRSLPEVLVRGSRFGSQVGARIMDDVTPYVVFTRSVLQRSPAVSVAEFLGSASSAIASNSRLRPDPVTLLPDEIDLRGFGSSQTLVLVNGQRMTGHSFGGLPLQPGIEAIPLSAIERIELYQANRSAVYGPGAAGGVINIVQRDDCSGLAQVDYGDTFSRGSNFRRVYLAHCFSPSDRTQAKLSGSWSQEAELSTAERSFFLERRLDINRRRPEYFGMQGAPPLGAQTNIRSVDGSPLFGPGTPSYASIPTGYRSTDGLDPLRATAGRYDLRLAEGAQMFGGRDRALRSGPETTFFNGSLRHRFNDSITASLDAMRSTSEVSTPVSAADTSQFSTMLVLADAPNNPFRQNVLVTAPLGGADIRLESERAAGRVIGGVSFDLTDNWNGTLGLTWSRAELKSRRPLMSSAVAEKVAVGALDVMRDLQRDPLDLSDYIRHDGYSTSLRTDVASANLALRGVVSLGGWRPAYVSAMYERQVEHFLQRDSVVEDPLLGILSSSLTSERRDIESAFADLRIPILGAGESSSAQRLDIQASFRSDSYSPRSRTPDGAAGASGSDNSATFSAKSKFAAMRYQPWDAITFRGSWGTGFLPPTTSQLARPTFFPFPAGALRDAKRGGEPTQALSILGGGNPDLDPERTRTWSVGIVLQRPNLTASLDFIRTSMSDGIISPAELLFVDPAGFEDLYPGRVQREARQAGDPYEDGRIVGIDATAINSSQVDISAVDGWLEYKLPETRFGGVKFSLQATWQPTLRMRNGLTGAFENLIGASGEYPVEVAAIGGVTLARGRWGMGWSMRYLDHYRVSPNLAIEDTQGASQVKHQSFHDLYVQYRAGFQRDVELTFSVRNVFGKEPPFDAASADYFSAFGDPRLSMYALSLVTHF